MKHDMLARERLNRIRIDSNSIQNRIETARKHLFAFGALVNGTKVDGQLKKDSLVPTRVSSYMYEDSLGNTDTL